METTKIILADDHTLFREGVKKLLESISNIEIVAEASSGKELFNIVDKIEHDLILTDISMPDGTGTEIVEQLAAEGKKWVRFYSSLCTLPMNIFTTL